MKCVRKVVHVTIGHPPTDDRIFFKEACSLAKNGCAVTIVGPGRAEQKEASGVRFVLFAPNGFFHSLFAAYRLARCERADVYHIHEFEFLPFALWLKYKYGRKVIYDAHETVFWFFMDFSRRHFLIRLSAACLAQGLEFLTMRGADYLITVTPWVEKHLRAFHPRRAIVYNYPITTIFDGNHAQHTPPLILYHGQLTPGRNIELMIAAMRHVREHAPEAHLHLVGASTAAYRQILLRIVADWNLTGQVKILPPVPHSAIPELLRQTAIGLAALQLNESYRRSIQVKPFEFMAMGVPVIGARVPSIEKYVVASGAGLVVEPLTPENLGALLVRLLHDPGLRAEMGARGRQAVREKYNWDCTLPALLQVYRNLLAC